MSAEFIFRIFGMIFFGSGGVWAGVHLSRMADDDPELWTLVFGLVGVLIGLILTPYISIRPIRSARDLLGRVSARTLFAGILGLMVALLIAGLLSFPLSLLPPPSTSWKTSVH